MQYLHEKVHAEKNFVQAFAQRARVRCGSKGTAPRTEESKDGRAESRNKEKGSGRKSKEEKYERSGQASEQTTETVQFRERFESGTGENYFY